MKIEQCDYHIRFGLRRDKKKLRNDIDKEMPSVCERACNHSHNRNLLMLILLQLFDKGHFKTNALNKILPERKKYTIPSGKAGRQE